MNTAKIGTTSLEQHPLSGHVVKLVLKKWPLNAPSGHPGLEAAQLKQGDHFHVEDWANRVFERSWFTLTNWTIVNYCTRQEESGLPLDNKVVYGHVRGFAHMVHQSELGKLVT